VLGTQWRATKYLFFPDTLTSAPLRIQAFGHGYPELELWKVRGSGVWGLTPDVFTQANIVPAIGALAFGSVPLRRYFIQEREGV
jgi:hypothetical protein